MPKSMTGYGRSDVKSRLYGEFSIEIQGVNRKYCDININLPKNMLVLEQKIREIVRKSVSRGRISVHIGQPRVYKDRKIHINKPLINKYFQALKKIKKEFKLKGEIDINMITKCPEFISVMNAEIEPSKIWGEIEKSLKKAIKDFQQMRQKEGHIICRQIEKPLTDIGSRIEKIRKVLPKIEIHFQKRLEERLNKIAITAKETDERVQREVAILAEHMDITEELNRMKSHVAQFKSLMKESESVGKTMDFIIQEMLREANTMGSKAVHTEISTHVIYIKSKLEIIREQIQNVE